MWTPFAYVMSGVLLGGAGAIYHLAYKYEAQRREYLNMKRYVTVLDETVCQVLGGALGYPTYDDDDDLVDVGNKSALDLAREAATRITVLESNLYDPR